MSYVKINVLKSALGGAIGASEGKDNHIVIWDWDDVKNAPGRDSKKIKMPGQFLFKENKYAILMYATSTTIDLPRSSDGEEDNISVTSLPQFRYPGSPLEIEEFFANWTGRSIGVAVKVGSCDGGEAFYRVFGTKCKPLSLMFEGQNNNDGTSDLVKFQQFGKSNLLPGRYYGTFTFDEAELVDQDTATPDVLAGSGEYQLQANTVPTAITALSNPVHGGVYTLIGSGGANASTIAAAEEKIFLLGGVDWTADAGARITLKAYEHTEGSFIFLEQARSI
ncbi:hypothetical protein JM79_3232 [Gramella sp. Hel_I_59]|uniref:hypothetical protein n=1 Tax=Gramella sp. Hel_I_59 TaxID=1249978 RepID=UPI0011545CE0|nr:hypothetical protein [Gramella sp. Hel_I_59]TQI72275.1 hypothetical protein JM79_3232 [Gramella sp. Hel_I_59]